MQNTTLFRALMLVFIYLTTLCFYTGMAQQTAPPANQWVLPTLDYEIEFQWHADSIQAYAALLIPVKLPYCNKPFYMQFDSGSPYSMFYASKVKAIQARYPKSVSFNESQDRLTDFSFKVGGKEIVAKTMIVKQVDSTGINWKEKNSIEIIGTIGVDFFEDKTLMIHYPERKISIRSAIPSALASSLTLSDFSFAGKRILLPAEIRNKKTLLYFDTGSSAYPLLTDKATSLSLSTPNSTPVQHPVKSWNRQWVATTLQTQDSVKIVATRLPIHTVTYMEGVSDSQIAQMMKMGIGGMTGNRLFLNAILILDTKNKKFGIVPVIK